MTILIPLGGDTWPRVGALACCHSLAVMVDPLSDSQSKIEWANEHLMTLDGFADQFLETEPYAAVPHFEADGLEKVWTLEVRAKPWPRIGLAIGDVVHNARSALDAAVVSLAGHALRVHSRRALTEDEERKLQFPICRAKDEFVERAKRCLSSVPPPAQAFIEGCQPYNGADFGTLAFVERLSNIDKHRRVHVLAARRTGDTAPVLPSGVPQPRRLPGVGPLEHGAEVMRYVFPAPHAYVDVEPEFAFSVAVPEVTGEPIVHVLGNILAVIEQRVLRGLCPFF